jgi:hypothetical protein
VLAESLRAVSSWLKVSKGAVMREKREYNVGQSELIIDIEAYRT